jgi:hypothetical protein
VPLKHGRHTRAASCRIAALDRTSGTPLLLCSRTNKDYRGVVRVDATVFPHLAQKPRYALPVLAQELGVACFGLAASLLYTTKPRAFLAVSHLAYTARVLQPQLHSHAHASTASLEPTPALPHQSSSARAPPHRELRFSTAWPTYCASRVHTRACGHPLLTSVRSPAPAQAEPPHTALAHALQPSAGGPLLGSPEPPLQCLLAVARAPVLPPESASRLAHLRRFHSPVLLLGATRHESLRQPSRPHAPSNCRLLPLLCTARARAQPRAPRQRSARAAAPARRPLGPCSGDASPRARQLAHRPGRGCLLLLGSPLPGPASARA